MSERRLRQSYDMMLALRADADLGREECPEVERLLALVQKSGDEDVRLLLLDHVMACPYCHAEFELLRATHRVSGDSLTMDE